MREGSDATDDDSLGVAPTWAEQHVQRRGPAGSWGWMFAAHAARDLPCRMWPQQRS